MNITGDAHDIIVDAESKVAPKIAKVLAHDGRALNEPSIEEREDGALVAAQRLMPLHETTLNEINILKGVRSVWNTRPTKFPKPGEPLFQSGSGLADYAEKAGCSLGEAALDYEADLLGITRDEAIDEIWRRYEIMAQGVERELRGEFRGMQLLEPSAQKIYEREERGDLAIGGLHTKAAARALAGMHVNSSMGVVCAAPTGGAAGTIPGVIMTLVEEKGLEKIQTVNALFAAGAVGLVLATRGTFAAEVAGARWRSGPRGHVLGGGCGGGRGIGPAGVGRCSYLVPEHPGLSMRPGQGHGGDPVPHS